ncbi:MAG TPA: hypothetical protein VGO22_17125 [Pseudorhizobium sp.]|jgi:hypothetical protein|nr:hypothetical protein [Pseudorhizobium sp.]
MMNSKPDIRYDMRKEPDDTWTVYDIFTGKAAEVNGVPQDGLDMETADDLVDLLNAEYIARRGGMTH